MSDEEPPVSVCEMCGVTFDPQSLPATMSTTRILCLPCYEKRQAEKAAAKAKAAAPSPSVVPPAPAPAPKPVAAAAAKAAHSSPVVHLGWPGRWAPPRLTRFGHLYYCIHTV